MPAAESTLTAPRSQVVEPPRPVAPESGFRPDIEGLRGVAVLLVVAFHYDMIGVGGGFIGVDVFFVLSGYLITRLLTAEAERTGRVDLLDFYARRARRILPAAALVLLVTMAVGAVLLAPLEQRAHARMARATALYISNLRFGRALDYFGVNAEKSPFLHTWSLSVEEQFYLVWPALLLACCMFVRWRHGWRATVVIATAGSFALSAVLTAGREPWGFFATPSRIWEFGLGAMALWVPVAFLRHRPHLTRALGWGGLVAVCGLALLYDWRTPFPGVAALGPALGTAAILAAGSAMPGAGAGRLLSTRPLTWIGRHSYSWYLWHWPVLVFMSSALLVLSPGARLAGVVISLALAVASFRLVEYPIRHNRWLGEHRVATLAGALALTCLCFGGSVAWKRYAAGLMRAPEQRSLEALRVGQKRAMRACSVRFGDAKVTECWSGPEGAATTVVVIGDSHAAHWYPAFQRLAEARGWRMGVMTKAGCPTPRIDVFVPRHGTVEPECAEWRESVLARLRSLRPSLVVLSNFSGYITGTGPARERPQLSYQEWEAGLRSTLLALDTAGVRTLLLRDIPQPGFDVPTCISQSQHWGMAPGPRCALEREWALDDRIFAAETRAAAGLAHAVAADTRDWFCSGDACRVIIGGEVVYADGNHLMKGFAEALAPRLGALIERAIARSPGAPAGA